MGRRQFMRMVVAVATLAVPAMASAAITLTLEPEQTTVDPGTTFYIDVLATYTTDPLVPGFVEAFGVEVVISSLAGGLSFYEPVLLEPRVPLVTNESEAPIGYILPSGDLDSWYTDDDLRDPTDVFDEAVLSWEDSQFQPRSLTDGTTYSAGRFYLQAAPNAAGGTQTVSLQDAEFIYLGPTGDDEFLHTVDLSQASVQINVNPAVTPEPSAAVLLALTGVAGIVVKRRKKSRSAAA